MARLYELTEAYAALVAMLEDCESASEEEEILAELASCNDAIGDKAEAYARIMRNMLSDIEGCKAEIDRLTAKKQRAENAVSRLKTAMLDYLTATNQKKIKTELFSKQRVVPENTLQLPAKLQLKEMQLKMNRALA